MKAYKMPDIFYILVDINHKEENPMMFRAPLNWRVDESSEPTLDSERSKRQLPDNIKDVFFKLIYDKENIEDKIRTTVYLTNGNKGTATQSVHDSFDPFVGILIAKANAEFGSKKKMKLWALRKFNKFLKIINKKVVNEKKQTPCEKNKSTDKR